MTIAFSCPACRKKIEVPGELAGRKAKCKGCGGPLVIPTPRVAPIARELGVENPYDLSEADEVEEPHGLYDDERPIVPPRSTVPRPKPAKRATRPTKGPGFVFQGVEAVSSIIFFALGIVAIPAGLLLIEFYTALTMIQGFSLPTSGIGFLAFFLLVLLMPLFLLGVGVAGFWKVYRLFNARASAESFRSLVGGVVILALAVIGIRLSRGTNPPPLALKLILADWDWVGGARPRTDAPLNDPERDHAAPKPGTPERAALVRRMIAEARADDSSLQNHGLTVLYMLEPDGAEQAGEVRTCLRSLLGTSTAQTLPLVIRALGRWGNAEDIPSMEARQNDRDLSVRSEAISCLAALRRQP